MKKNLIFSIFSAIIILGYTSLSVVRAESSGNYGKQAHKAKILVEKAIKMALTQGKAATFKAISNKRGPFVNKELYVFAGSTKKVTLLAHPYKSELLNKDLSLLNDGYGTYVIFALAKMARENGAGWLKYWWSKNRSKKKFPKISYMMKVPTQDYYIGCGYYPKK